MDFEKEFEKRGKVFAYACKFEYKDLFQIGGRMYNTNLKVIIKDGEEIIYEGQPMFRVDPDGHREIEEMYIQSDKLEPGTPYLIQITGQN